MDVTATEALELAEDKPFWRTIATAGRFASDDDDKITKKYHTIYERLKLCLNYQKQDLVHRGIGPKIGETILFSLT